MKRPRTIMRGGRDVMPGMLSIVTAFWLTQVEMPNPNNAIPKIYNEKKSGRVTFKTNKQQNG